MEIEIHPIKSQYLAHLLIVHDSIKVYIIISFKADNSILKIEISSPFLYLMCFVHERTYVTFIFGFVPLQEIFIFLSN